MNWEMIEGKWKQYQGKVRDYWGRLTDDDLESVAGKRDRLSGIIQERYGVKKDEAEKQIDQFLERKKTRSKL